MSLSKFQIWLMACRPKTLPAAIAPVILGTALAIGDGGYHIPSALLALLGAFAVQIGTNLANDYYDFKKGVDTSERIGPLRVTQAGLLKPESVRLGFILAFALVAIIAAALTLRAGWLIMFIGVLAIISGIFYTAGRRPLGYIGLGEIFVFIFFGPVAVSATYYIQTLEINLAVILAGIGPGLLAAAILVVNNLRDLETDRKSKKNTLAVRFGAQFSQAEYYVLLIGASLMPVVIFFTIQDHFEICLSMLILFFAVPTLRTIFSSSTDGPALNRALADTGLLLFLYSLLFSLGWIYADLRF